MTATPGIGLQLIAMGTVTVTDPTLNANIAAMVTAGTLTAARAAQVLNLALASP